MRAYQQEIELNTLYSCVARNTGNGDTLKPFLEVVGGLVNVYGSVASPGSPPAGMTNSEPEGFSGIKNWAVIPNYIYINQKSGTTTSIILSGVEATVVP